MFFYYIAIIFIWKYPKFTWEEEERERGRELTLKYGGKPDGWTKRSLSGKKFSRRVFCNTLNSSNEQIKQGMAPGRTSRNGGNGLNFQYGLTAILKFEWIENSIFLLLLLIYFLLPRLLTSTFSFFSSFLMPLFFSSFKCQKSVDVYMYERTREFCYFLNIHYLLCSVFPQKKNSLPLVRLKA